MKQRLFFFFLILFPVFSYAQEVRTIVCQDQLLQTEILRFSTWEGKKIYDSADYSLEVEPRGDNIAKMTLTTKGAVLFLSAHRTEGLLTSSASVDGADPVIFTSATRKGSAQTSVALNSLSAKVVSYERKGESSLSLEVITPMAHQLSCKTIR